MIQHLSFNLSTGGVVMAYSEVETTGWGSRLISSIFGVLVGIVLFIVSFPLLFWNEGRAVKTAQGLEEGSAAAVSIADPSKVDTGADGKLVHMSGKAETKETLKDDQFGVSVPAIRLVRDVEMYQYKENEKKEKKKKLGGGEQTVTTYTYEPTWSSTWIDSASFHDPDWKGKNPASMPYKGETWNAKEIRVGGYRLTESLAGQIKGDETLTVTTQMLEVVPTELREKLQVKDNAFYQVANSANKEGGPTIGDVRITYKQVKNGVDVSLVSKQAKDTFEPYVTHTDTKINDLRMGVLTKDGMFDTLKSENNMMTWILRGVGLALMAIGIGLCFKPLVVIADFLPILGDFVQAGFMLVAIGLAIPLTLITIAAGWIAYRPMVGIPLMAVAVLGLVGLFVVGRKRKAAKAAA
jgi:hypothetical protein